MLRIALVKFHVNTESLSRVLHVTSTLYRRSRGITQAQNVHPIQSQSNTIANVILETLVNGLRLKARLQSTTIMSILEASYRRFPVVYLS